MKDWKHLTVKDFQISDPDWIPSLQATVRFGHSEVTLTIGEADMATDEQVSCLSKFLVGWKDNLPDIAKQTETYLQVFLPGRRVKGSDLCLWGVTLHTDEGQPTGGCFFYNVAGEYDSPAYKLDQFDHRSVIELDCPIEGGEVIWTQRNIAATNDFD